MLEGVIYLSWLRSSDNIFSAVCDLSGVPFLSCTLTCDLPAFSLTTIRYCSWNRLVSSLFQNASFESQLSSFFDDGEPSGRKWRDNGRRANLARNHAGGRPFGD